MSGFVFDSTGSKDQLVTALQRINHDNFDTRIVKLADGLYIGLCISNNYDYYEEDGYIVLTDGIFYRTQELNNAKYFLDMYKTFSTGAFSLLNGGFLGVIIDLKLNIVCITKDRHGVGRIQYQIKNGDLVASSELKAILETNFNPINCPRLDNGYYLVYDIVAKVPHTGQFYDYSLPEENTLSFEENSLQLRDLFFTAIKRSIKNITIPVGVALSGIDSMAVAYTLSELLGKENVKLLTVACNDPFRKSSDGYNLHILSEFLDLEGHLLTPDLEKEHTLEEMKNTAYFLERTTHSGFTNGVLFKAVLKKATELGIKDIFTNEDIDVYFGSDPICTAYYYKKELFWPYRNHKMITVKHYNHRYRSNTTFISPDADNDFSDFCMTVPNKFRRYSGFTNKAVFRSAFANDLPEEIVKRPKLPSVIGAGIKEWYLKKDKEDKTFFDTIFKEVFDNRRD